MLHSFDGNKHQTVLDPDHCEQETHATHSPAKHALDRREDSRNTLPSAKSSMDGSQESSPMLSALSDDTSESKPASLISNLESVFFAGNLSREGYMTVPGWNMDRGSRPSSSTSMTPSCYPTTDLPALDRVTQRMFLGDGKAGQDSNPPSRTGSPSVYSSPSPAPPACSDESEQSQSAGEMRLERPEDKWPGTPERNEPNTATVVSSIPENRHTCRSPRRRPPPVPRRPSRRPPPPPPRRALQQRRQRHAYLLRDHPTGHLRKLKSISEENKENMPLQVSKLGKSLVQSQPMPLRVSPAPCALVPQAQPTCLISFDLDETPAASEEETLSHGVDSPWQGQRQKRDSASAAMPAIPLSFDTLLTHPQGNLVARPQFEGHFDAHLAIEETPSTPSPARVDGDRPRHLSSSSSADTLKPTEPSAWNQEEMYSPAYLQGVDLRIRRRTRLRNKLSRQRRRLGRRMLKIESKLHRFAQRHARKHGYRHFV